VKSSGGYLWEVAYGPNNYHREAAVKESKLDTVLKCFLRRLHHFFLSFYFQVWTELLLCLEEEGTAMFGQRAPAHPQTKWPTLRLQLSPN